MTTVQIASPAAGEGMVTRSGYLPIAEHGIVGDLHTAALAATDGTIDWYCPERLDGASVFASLLDRRRGGFYRLAPTDRGAATKQLYLPDTGVLITPGSCHRTGSERSTTSCRSLAVSAV